MKKIFLFLFMPLFAFSMQKKQDKDLISRLPEEIWESIFVRLKYQDKVNILLVTKKDNKCFAIFFTHIYLNKIISNKDLKKKRKRIKTLAKKYVNICSVSIMGKDASMKYLSSFLKLKEIYILGNKTWYFETLKTVDLDEECIDYLSKLKKLQSISLTRGYGPSDSDVEKLKKITSLQHIKLCGPVGKISDKGLENLASFQSLKSLALCKYRDLNYEGLMFISNLSNLKSISLVGSIGFSDIKFLNALTKLEEIELSDHFIQDTFRFSSSNPLGESVEKIFITLRSLTNLKSITFSLSPNKYLKDLSPYLITLSTLTNLEYFNKETMPRELILDSLSNLTQIKNLSCKELYGHNIYWIYN